MPTRQFRPITIGKVDGRRRTFLLYPSAQDVLKDWLRKAEKKGVISGPTEIATCEAALISAGINKARSRGSAKVTVTDMSLGWHEQLESSPFADLCFPPINCYQRSIIQRTETLKTALPVFDELLARIESD